MPAAPPEPIDGRRTATEPTADAPPTPPAATHRHRALDPTPTSTHATTGPRRCRTNAARANAARANRRETHRDGAHRRRSGDRAAHTARRHAPSPRPRRDPHVLPRHDRTTPLPHECLTSPCRQSQSTGDAPPRSPHRRSGARRRPHLPPPRTVTTSPTRPPRPPTPRQDHARFSRRRAARSGRAAASRKAIRPSSRCTDALGCTRRRTLPHPCAGARPRRSARPSHMRALSALAERVVCVA